MTANVAVFSPKWAIFGKALQEAFLSFGMLVCGADFGLFHAARSKGK